MLSREEKIMFAGLFLLFFSGFLIRFHVVGFGIGSGGNFYYSQLVSLTLDGDINIKNQVEELPFYEKLSSPLFYERTSRPFLEPQDYMNPETAIGSAILWMPFFIVAHLLVLFLNLFGAGLLTNGFSAVHQIITMAGSILYATIGLFIIYRFASKFFSRKSVWISLLAVVFGFSVVQYVMIEPSIGHAATLFTVPLFLYYFYEHRHDNSARKWAMLGFFGGIMTLSRWQEGFFLFVPFIYFLKDLWRATSWNARGLLASKAVLFLAVLLATFSPQMVIWKIFNGGFFSLPSVAQSIMDFTHPWVRIPYFLFSFHHSLLISTPILLLSLFGAYQFYKKDKFFCLTLVFMLVVIIYINSSLTEMGGNAFGARRLIDSTFIFVIFLTGLVSSVAAMKTKTWYYLLLAFIVLLVAFNLLYFAEYNLNLIHRAEPVPYSLILEKAGEIFSKFKSLLS